MAGTVEVPSGGGGLASSLMSIRGSRSVKACIARADMPMPGRIAPPWKAPSRETRFTVIAEQPGEWESVSQSANCEGVLSFNEPLTTNYLASLVDWAHANKDADQFVLLLIDGLEGLHADTSLHQSLRWLRMNAAGTVLGSADGVEVANSLSLPPAGTSLYVAHSVTALGPVTRALDIDWTAFRQAVVR